MSYLRNYYKVPVKRGGLVSYEGRRGKITSSTSHVHAILDGDKHPSVFHPHSLLYLSDDGETVVCDPKLCSKCKERAARWYSLCGECLSPSYAALVGYKQKGGTDA